MNLESLFLLRYRIARIGESDWLQWWTSHALSDEGHYVVGRIFRRTTALTSAHLAVAAARVRHTAQAPRAPVVHLFDFGEEIEGEFDRWLIARKADGWQPPALPGPSDDARAAPAAALAAVGLPLRDEDIPARPASDEPFVIGTVNRAGLRADGRLMRVSNQLAHAYASLPLDSFAPPLLRLEG